MNIVSGDSAKKEHLSLGAKTACNRKMSIGKNERQEFQFILERHPYYCCEKCANYFKNIKR